jgi:hypothetical protein
VHKNFAHQKHYIKQQITCNMVTPKVQTNGQDI